jgi:LCP family protein required for cell wall assembly
MFEHLDDPHPPSFGSGFRRGVVLRAQRRRRRRRLAGGAGVATASLMAGVGGLYGRAAWRANDVDRIDVAGTADVAAGEPVTVLVAGLDDPAGEGDAGGRPDALLLARLDPRAGTAALLSIPRDLMVDAPGGGRVRINDIGDQGALVGVVESQLGVGIDHYVAVTYEGFEALVDHAGGIDVRVDVPVRDPHSGMLLGRPGCVTLDGGRALALVRSRHLEVWDEASGTWVPDTISDLRRVTIQRQLVVAALAGVVDEGAGPVAADRLAGIVADNVAVDTALSLDDVVTMVRAAGALAPADVAQATLPVVSDPADVNRLVPDPHRAPAAVRAFLAGEPPPAGAGELPDAAELPGGAVVDPC